MDDVDDNCWSAMVTDNQRWSGPSEQQLEQQLDQEVPGVTVGAPPKQNHNDVASQTCSHYKFIMSH